MALAGSRLPPSTGSRPGYLDNLYNSRPPHQKNASLSSTASTNSYNSASSPIDARATQPIPRPLTPALEEEQSDDIASVRSLRVTLTPRGKLRSILNRRTYPQVTESIAEDQTGGTSIEQRSASRRPSLPKLHTAFSATSQKPHRRHSKPLPQPPRPKAEELSCKQWWVYCWYTYSSVRLTTVVATTFMPATAMATCLVARTAMLATAVR